MALFIQIITGLLLAAIVVAGIYFYPKIRERLKGGTNNSYLQIPLTIHLVEDLSPEWMDDKDAKSLIEDFKTLGFYTGKSYIIHELHESLLLSLFFGDFAAVVAKHPIMGYWCEVAYQREDGKIVIATNARFNEESKSHPEHIRFYNGNARPIDLYNLVKNETAKSFAAKITDGNFRYIYEKVYNQDMSWRNNHGGVTIQEFKKKLKTANSKLKLTKEDLRKVFLEMKVDELHQWHEACIEEYKKNIEDQSTVNGKKQLFIVPRKTISNAYIEYLVDFDIVHKSVKEKLVKALRKKTDIPKIFDIINSNFSDDLRAEHVGEVSFPLNAQIYKRAGKPAGKA